MAFVRLKGDSSVWLARFYGPDGKKIEKSTGTRERRQAQKIADAYEAAARRKFTVAHVQRTLRELMADSSAAPVPGSTVAEFFRDYVERRTPELAASSLVSVRLALTRFLEWAAGNLPLGSRTEMSAVEPAHVQAFRAWRLEIGSPTTTRNTIIYLRHVFEQARQRAVIMENPFVSLGRLKRDVANSSIRPFSLEEVRSVLAICGGDPEWRRMVLFGFYTGQRLGDICRLSWANVQLVRGEISFVMRKTGRQMVLPLPPVLIADLAETLALDRLGPLHPRAHALVSAQSRVVSVSNQFHAILVRARLVAARPHSSRALAGKRQRCPLGFHSFRHTATSQLRDAGAPVGVAMHLVGHESRAVHQHYAHVGSDTLRRAVSLLPTL